MDWLKPNRRLPCGTVPYRLSKSIGITEYSRPRRLYLLFLLFHAKTTERMYSYET